jgi:drug/metabolite transporter (DMT)-like permease
LLLFEALRYGPAYLVFPLVSLYPVLTILLSVLILKERASRRGWTGIAAALPAIVLLSWQPPSTTASTASIWLPLAVLVFVLWGVQAFVMKFANERMAAESIFFYMMATGLALVPVALLMTNFAAPINWGLRGPVAAAAIQVLNAIGALSLVYAVRYGKAIIVVPMTSLAPMLTILISLLLYQVVPGPVLLAGMTLAVLAIVLLAE